MQIVIDIPKEIYEELKSYYKNITGGLVTHEAIANGKTLPKGHGRLIDADKVTSELLTIDSNYACMADWCLQVIDAQPTIIEAEKGGE